MPNADKALYLDADTIVLESPVALWQTELDDSYLAAVANPLYPFMDNKPRVDLGIADPRQYINSGVLLMNLEEMRRDGFAKLLLEYARAHPENPYPDQDALNALASDRHVSLHPRWNAQTTLWDLRIDELPFSSDEIQQARARPAIVHFIGPFKPWHYLCTHPYRSRYFEELAATPWPAPELEGRTMVNRVLRHLPPAWVYRSLHARDALAGLAWHRRPAGAAGHRS